MTAPAVRIDELRTLFLFEKLTDEQLDWLCREGHVEQCRAGPGLRRGRAGDLLLRAARRRGGAVPAGSAATTSRSNRTDQRGVYAGAWQAYLGDRVPQIYNNSMRVTEPSRFFVLDADDVRRRHAASGSRWRCTCWRGCSSASQNTQQAIGQRERLLALGSLSAGLTHELNNPAAAAVRATVVAARAGRRHAAQAGR